MARSHILAGFYTEPNGDRARVEIEAEIGAPVEHMTTEHTTAMVHRLSITGSTYEATASGAIDRRHRDPMISGGQSIEDLQRVLDEGEIALPRESLVELLDIWQRWHLNDMRAGCAHQSPTWTCTNDRNAAIRKQITHTVSRGPVTSRRDLVELHVKKAEVTADWVADVMARMNTYESAVARLSERAAGEIGALIPVTEPCGTLNGWPEIERLGLRYPKRGDACHVCGRDRCNEPTDRCPTGYAWGRAWLAEEPPAEVLDFIRRLFSIA
jgi:hypothetical protein